MSVGYAEVLLNHAHNYLKSAKRNKAEITAQLALKAAIARYGVEPPRTRSIRKISSYIIENRLFEERVLDEIRGLLGAVGLS